MANPFDLITTKLWCGVTMYCCPYCPFDAEAVIDVKLHMRQHFQRMQAAQEEALTPAVPLFDANDKLITQMPTDQPLVAEILKTMKVEEKK